jgi:predicted nucleic acid-binding protein
MITYVDTSTLLKLIIEEPGSDVAAALWDDSDGLTSVSIMYAEARAALAAARRAGRVTSPQHRSAVEMLDDLWSQLFVVAVDDGLVLEASELAERHGLRGYDAVHLAAALRAGASVVSSADRALCEAARAEGFHVANPIDAPDSSQAPSAPADMDDFHAALQTAAGFTFTPEDVRQNMTKNSGLFDIPIPANSVRRKDPPGGFTAVGVGTIEDLTHFYKDFMSSDGWIFDRKSSALEPYQAEDKKLGYITNSIYVKPTEPVTTVAIIVGNADGQPGHKRDLTIYILRTSDDELPENSTRLG